MSRIRLDLSSDYDQDSFVDFDPRFIAISFCIPFVLVVAALFTHESRLMSKNAKGAVVIKCCLCSLLCGLSSEWQIFQLLKVSDPTKIQLLVSFMHVCMCCCGRCNNRKQN